MFKIILKKSRKETSRIMHSLSIHQLYSKCLNFHDLITKIIHIAKIIDKYLTLLKR